MRSIVVAHPAPQHRLAHQLHLGLRLVLALLALATLWALQREWRGHLAALGTWPRHVAVIESLADEHTIELEVANDALEAMPLVPSPHSAPNREGHSRVLLPRPSYLWGGLRDTVDLAHDPQDPRRVLLLDFGSLWLPVFAKGVLLALLALGWMGQQRLNWGRDRVWRQGDWTDSAAGALRPGSRAAAGDELREPAAHRRGTRFWAVLMGLATAALLLGGWVAWDDEPVGVAATGIVVGALDLLLLHTFITVRTRRVRWDAEGICDTSLFQTQRVPWAAVARFERVNVAHQAQQQFDRQSLSSRRGRLRPKTDLQWIARDVAGHELLRLPGAVQEQPAFAALMRRLGRVGAAAADDDDGVDDEEVDDGSSGPAFRAANAALDAPGAQMQRRHLGGMRWGIALVLAPFVASAVYATAQSMWFVLAAERVEGTVVGRSEDGLPSLTVTYTPRGASLPLQIESDGTEAYGAVPLGAKITVFHDAADPAHARLDLFFELWLWPMLLGGLAFVVAVPFLLALRSMSRAQPTHGP